MSSSRRTYSLKLDTDKLCQAIEDLGYTPELNYSNPGIEVDGKHIDWEDIGTVLDVTSKVV